MNSIKCLICPLIVENRAAEIMCYSFFNDSVTGPAIDNHIFTENTHAQLSYIPVNCFLDSNIF